MFYCALDIYFQVVDSRTLGGAWEMISVSLVLLQSFLFWFKQFKLFNIYA